MLLTNMKAQLGCTNTRIRKIGEMCADATANFLNDYSW